MVAARADNGRPSLARAVRAYGVLVFLAASVWLSLRVGVDGGPPTLTWGALALLAAVFAPFALTRIYEKDAAIAGETQHTVVTWAGTLLFGPAVLWIDALITLARPILARRAWTDAADALLTAGKSVAASLTGLYLLNALTVAPAGSAAWMGPALVATGVRLLLSLLLAAPVVTLELGREATTTTRLVLFLSFWRSILLYYVAPSFLALIVVVAYRGAGSVAALTTIGGVWVLSVATYIMARDRQRQGEAAQANARAAAFTAELLAEPVGSADLPAITARHLPGLATGHPVEVWLGDEYLLRNATGPLFSRGQWERQLAGEPAPGATMVLPIVQPDDGAYVGALAIGSGTTSSNAAFTESIRTVAGSLGAYTARERHVRDLLRSQAEAFQTEVYSQLLEAEMTRELDRVRQEMKLARSIQTSLLPSAAPVLAGWDIAVRLEPARATSGDFYDFISLPDGRVGLVVADVADKGLGAALYMALSRTLLRTFAVSSGSVVGAVTAANRRILADSNSDLFVTVFYGVLDPATGRLDYVNAGHNPPLVVPAAAEAPVRQLRRTGMPLGIIEDAEWSAETLTLEPGDILVLYSDGITEAQDEDHANFELHRLERVLLTHAGRSAAGLSGAIFRAVKRFVQDAPQHDDMTLVLVLRDAA